jgi:hypothetical protein
LMPTTILKMHKNDPNRVTLKAIVFVSV